MKIDLRMLDLQLLSVLLFFRTVLWPNSVRTVITTEPYVMYVKTKTLTKDQIKEKMERREKTKKYIRKDEKKRKTKKYIKKDEKKRWKEEKNKEIHKKR